MIRCLLFLFLSISCVSAFVPMNGNVRLSGEMTVSPSRTDALNYLGNGSQSSSSRIQLKSDDMTEEEYEAAIDKATGAMAKFTSTYLKRSETTLCTDKAVAAAVVKGLAKHKVELGAPLCPCRFYEDKEEEVKKGYWNCPCVPMREDKICQCCLFLTPEHPFAGEEQDISKEEVLDLAKKIKKD